VIELNGVTKRFGFRPRQTAIDGLDLTIAEPGIHCLLGRNGAGKTTLLRLIAGNLLPTKGRVLVDGRATTTFHVPTQIAYVEPGAGMYNMPVRELIAAAARVQDGFDSDFAATMVRRFELDPDKRYRSLSFGMRTMLTTILTLANDSPIVLLDEPALGLDAIARERFNELLLESQDANPRMIVVSTHLIDDIAKVAQYLIVIDRGRLVMQGSLDDVDERAYTLTGPVVQMEPLVAGLNVLNSVREGATMVADVYGDRIQVPAGVRMERLGLQDFFIDLVGGEPDA
jgi:ABC-2 type transport system ATP-binding protein